MSPSDLEFYRYIKDNSEIETQCKKFYVNISLIVS
jgi:hypothetical protein